MKTHVLKDTSNKLVAVASSLQKIVNAETISSQKSVETRACEDKVLIDDTENQCTSSEKYIQFYDTTTKQHVSFRSFSDAQLEAKPYELHRSGYDVYKINKREGIYCLLPKFKYKTSKNKHHTLLAVQKGKLVLSLGGGIFIKYKSGDVIHLEKSKYI